jgi:hypothetical protein
MMTRLMWDCISSPSPAGGLFPHHPHEKLWLGSVLGSWPLPISQLSQDYVGLNWSHGWLVTLKGTFPVKEARHSQRMELASREWMAPLVPGWQCHYHSEVSLASSRNRGLRSHSQKEILGFLALKWLRVKWFVPQTISIGWAVFTLSTKVVPRSKSVVPYF